MINSKWVWPRAASIALVTTLLGAMAEAAVDRVPVAGPGGVTLHVDPRLKYPVPRPENLPLVVQGQATARELLEQGRNEWFTRGYLEAEPFAIPTELAGTLLPFPNGGARNAISLFADLLTGAGMVHVRGEKYPRGLVEMPEKGMLTQTCSGCHSGVVNGRIIPGVNNKWYDQDKVMDATKLVLRSAIPVLAAQGPSRTELLQKVSRQLAKVESYDVMIGDDCPNLSPGVLSATRIWAISTKLLTKPEQMSDEANRKRFICGAVKPPALNTIKYRNLFFTDGSVNGRWVSHWPMFDIYGYDQYETWLARTQSREVQALDAYLDFGTESPSYEDVMQRNIRRDMSAKGYEIFHRDQACASCHGQYSKEGWLQSYAPSVTHLSEIKTHAERAVGSTDELLEKFLPFDWAFVPRMQVPGPAPEVEREYGSGYSNKPLCSTFAMYPYLHTSGVANLYELLLPEDKRSRVYFQSDVIDPVRMGYYTPSSVVGRDPRSFFKYGPSGQPPRFYVRQINPIYSKGHSGERYGTNLSKRERWNLVEYLKSLRCPIDSI